MTRTYWWVLAGTLLVLGVIGAGLYWWSWGPAPPSERPEEQLPREEVKLYFLNSRDYRLEIVKRRVEEAPDTGTRIAQVVEELTHPPEDSNLVALLPEDARVHSVFVDGQTIYLDFNDALVGAAQGSSGEMMLLYSIVNTVLANTPPSYKLVHFLVEGEMRKTIGAYGEESGHIAIQYPLGPRWDLADTS